MSGPATAAHPPSPHPPTARAGFRRYAAVWRLPGAPTLLVAGILGRLPIAMAPLVLVLLVARATGSYAVAGMATAVYAVANAAVAPVLGRLADRSRPVPVLLATGLAYPVAAAGVLVATLTGAPAAVIWASAAVLGGCTPPLTATLRSVWNDLAVPASGLREAALALETTAFEVVFVLGPLVVAALAVLVDSAAALVVAALLAAGGTVTVALGRATRGWRPHPDRVRVRGLGPAVAPGMPPLLLAAGALAFGFGVVGVAVPAFADQHADGHGDGLAGLLLGLWGVGSVTGGLWFGTRRFRAPLPTQWATTLALAAAGMAMLAVVPTAGLMAVALLCGGLALAPALTVENALIARIAPAGMLNEAYTWVVTTTFATSAAGAAAAGVLVERDGGVALACGLAGAGAALGAVVAAAPGTGLRRAGTAGR